MADFRLMQALRQKAPGKIVLLVMDGLGGLPIESGGPTELESARTPNLDRLAAEGTLGQTIPIRPGITPGSGPAHLALFGYDPLAYEVGRGVLEAIGVGTEVKKGDVAARGNFCTVNAFGKITDRRAGRIPTEEAAPIVEKLAHIRLSGVQIDVRQVKEYRFAVVMRGKGLEADIADTDPQQTGVEPLSARPLQPGSQRSADLFNAWMAEARMLLADQPKANSLTLRGFSTDPGLPQFTEIYGLRSACVAAYPMYKGVSRLAGMRVIEEGQSSMEDEIALVEKIWKDTDFLFLHIKKTDSAGEDGNRPLKVEAIEHFDHLLPRLLALAPDVLCITGDHSTPTPMKSHSFHPVPICIKAKIARVDRCASFDEGAFLTGGLGRIRAVEVLPLLLAHAGRLQKFGA